MIVFLPLVFLVSAFYSWLTTTNLTLFAYPENFAYPFFVEGGMLPYREIVDQHFPGLLLFSIHWRTLGIVGPEQARLAMLVIFALTATLLFGTTWAIYRDVRLSVLTYVFYALWVSYFGGNVFWLDSILPLFLIPAFYFGYRFFLVEERIKDVFLLGLFLGLTTVFKPLGLIMALAVTILILGRRQFKPIFFFFLGLFIPISAMLAYFVGIGVLSDFLRWAVVFNLTSYGQLAQKLPTAGQLTGVLVASVLPLIFFVREGHRGDFFYLSIWLVVLLIGVFPRFELFHFQPSLPFFSLVSAITTRELWRRRKVWKKMIPLVVVMAMLLAQFRFFQRSLTGVNFFFRSYHYQAADFILQNTDSDEPLFVFGGQDQLYPLAQRLPPDKFYVPQLPWYYARLGIQERVVASLEKDPPLYVLYVKDAGVDNQSLTDYGKIVFAYLEDNYQPTAEQYGPIQVWQQK